MPEKKQQLVNKPNAFQAAQQFIKQTQ